MIKKMKSKEYALGVERMDKEVGAPIDIAQSPMLMRSRRIQWNGCRVHDAASSLWSGSSITGGLRRGAVVCYRVVGSPEPQIR